MQKKLINSPSQCVEEAIQGVLLSDSNLLRVEGLNILVRKDIAVVKESFVTIISGKYSNCRSLLAWFLIGRYFCV